MKAAGTESAAPSGGLGLSISAFSGRQDLAVEAIRCLASEKSQTEFMKKAGNPAALASVFDDPGIREMFPMADQIREGLDAATPRPVSPYYGDVTGSIQTAFREVADALAGQATFTEQLRAQRAARREAVGRVRMDVATGAPSGKLVAELQNVWKAFPAAAYTRASSLRWPSGGAHSRPRRCSSSRCRRSLCPAPSTPCRSSPSATGVRTCSCSRRSSSSSTETAPLATDCHFQAPRSGVIGLPAPGIDVDRDDVALDGVPPRVEDDPGATSAAVAAACSASVRACACCPTSWPGDELRGQFT